MKQNKRTSKGSNEKIHTDEKKPVAWIIKGVDKEALRPASVHHPIICECGKKLTSNGGVARHFKRCSKTNDVAAVLDNAVKEGIKGQATYLTLHEGINGTLDISKEESVL